MLVRLHLPRLVVRLHLAVRLNRVHLVYHQLLPVAYLALVQIVAHLAQAAQVNLQPVALAHLVLLALLPQVV